MLNPHSLMPHGVGSYAAREWLPYISGWCTGQPIATTAVYQAGRSIGTRTSSSSSSSSNHPQYDLYKLALRALHIRDSHLDGHIRHLCMNRHGVQVIEVLKGVSSSEN